MKCHIIFCSSLIAAAVGCSDTERPIIQTDAGTNGIQAATTASDAGGGTTSTTSNISTTGGTTGTSGSTAGTSTGGTSTGGTGGAATGTTECEQVVMKAERTTPNMLIVLDRSGSMNDSMRGSVDRWTGSTQAINAVVGELEEDIRFGLLTYPGMATEQPVECENIADVDACLAEYTTCVLTFGNLWNPACPPSPECEACAAVLDNQCTPGELDVPIALQNAAPIASVLSGLRANGSTPTSASLAQAREVMANIEADMVAGSENLAPVGFIALVTDGEPNCVGQGGDRAAEEATIQEVRNLAADGVKTYVIGYQTAGTRAAGILDAVAAEGLTGDTQHRSVTNGDELLEEFRKITGSAINCTFVLATDVNKFNVEVRLNGNKLPMDGSWEIKDDKRTIELLGESCDALQGGALVEADVFCEPVQLE